ncbi:hypothetical protein MJD09_00750 [bacterium]|nr:hypothetical protein [bacterium]
MTQLMQQAIEELSAIPENKQDSVAAIILEEVLGIQQKWDQMFATEKSQDMLSQMADEALAEDDRGETLPLEKTLRS